MKIEWNKVTWYSKIVAVIVFVATFWIGFSIGAKYQAAADKFEAANQPVLLNAGNGMTVR